MSPILTRPVREQLEHDRVIRLLQGRYKRKHEVVINPGSEQNQSVLVGDLSVHPDLLLHSPDKARRLQATVEVETAESVNHLEALAEWGVFSKLKVPLHLYVPPQSLDTARRLCTELQIAVGEVWTYHLQFDDVRFTLAYRSPDAPAMPKGRAEPAKPARSKAVARRPAKVKPKPAARAKARPAPGKKAAKPAASKARSRKPVKKAKRR